MMKPWQQCVAFGLLGILIGQLLPRAWEKKRDSEAGGPAEDARLGTKVSRRDGGGLTTGQERWRREASKAGPKQFSDLISRAMEIPNVLERKTALYEILKYADASNGSEIIDGFAKLTWETGRTNTEAWRDALVEVGRKGGASVMDQFVAGGCNGGDQKLWVGLYGMASGDPQGAMNWLNGAGNEGLEKKNQLFSAVVSGAALVDAEEGIRMLASLPENIKRDCLGEFTWNLVQNGGLDRAVDWMLDVRRTSGASEPGFAGAAENEILKRIAGSVLKRGGTVEMAGLLSRINADKPVTGNQMVETTSRIPDGLRLNFLDQLARTSPMASSEAMDQALVFTIQQTRKGSSAAVEEWLEANPSSPIANRIREALAPSSPDAN